MFGVGEIKPTERGRKEKKEQEMFNLTIFIQSDVPLNRVTLKPDPQITEL